MAVILNTVSPHSGSKYFPADSPLKIEVTAVTNGVDAASVVIKVNQAVAWTGDAQAAGFTVVKTVITDGFSYGITPDADLEYGRQPLYVYAEEAAPGTTTLEETYYFEVGDVQLPWPGAPRAEAGLEEDGVEVFNSGAVSDPASLTGREQMGAGIYHGNELHDEGRRAAGLDDEGGFVSTGGREVFNYPGLYMGNRADERGPSLEESLYFALEDAATWNPVTYHWGAVTPTGSGPRVSSAVARDGHVVRVTFDRAMRVHPYLGGVVDPQNYHLTEDATGRRYYVLAALRVSSTEVDLYLESFTPFNLEYTLVVRKAQDAQGDPVDPLFDTVAFSAQNTGDVESNLIAFYGLQAGVDASEEPDVPPDIEAPYFQNQDPAPGSSDNFINDNVYLEIVDDKKGVDEDSVKLWLNGTLIWENKAAKPGYTILSAAAPPNGFSYDVDPDAPFVEGVTNLLRATALDVADIPNAMDDSYTFSTFKYTLEHISDFILRLTFSTAMKTTGSSGAALVDNASYPIQSVSGEGIPGPGIWYPSAANLVSDKIVDLTIPLSTEGEVFRMTIVGAIETASGAPVYGQVSEFTSETSHPRVLRVDTEGSRTLVIIFTRDLLDNVDLVNPSAYQFSGGLRAERVIRLSSTSVQVNLSGAMESGQTYLLSVRANP